jgi:hypothetical protein
MVMESSVRVPAREENPRLEGFLGSDKFAASSGMQLIPAGECAFTVIFKPE